MEVEAREIRLKNGESCLIRSLGPEDAKAALFYLKTVTEETPFMISESDEVTMTLEEESNFLERRRTSTDGVQLGAFLDGELVGIASVERISERSRLRHRGTYAIGLKEKAWGLGIGTQLSQILISLAPKMGLTQLELGVMAPNKRAIALYEKLGFQPYGTIPNASRLRTGETMDEVLMYFFL